MEAWRRVWREGFAPVISTSGLRALRDALDRDDARIIQHATTCPTPVQSTLGWPAEGACVIGFAAWQGDDAATVGAVEEAFCHACFEADVRLGEPAACRWFLNWYDAATRVEMVNEMLAEVEHELGQREQAEEPWEVELVDAAAA